MGTPDFAVASLEALIANNFNVVGVVTMPDKPAGRGHKIQFSPVKECALKHNLPLLQPTNLKDAEFQAELAALKADIQVVVAFRMLPEAVWAMPPMGTINVHGSLLPNYRGAAPVNWAVINGEKETGVTTFQLKHEIDTGAILKQKKTPITPEDTAGSVYVRLMNLGAELLVETLTGLFDNAIEPIPQNQLMDEADIKHAPKIFKPDCAINWNQPAERIFNFIRGMAPFPGANTYVKVQDKKLLLKVKSSELTENPSSETGLLEIKDKSIFVHTNDFQLKLTDIQLEGKRAMAPADLLNGTPLENQNLISF